jgi:hypothetical protein
MKFSKLINMNILLISLILVILIFGLLSIYEFIQINDLQNEIEQLKNSQLSPLPGEGIMFIQGVGTFEYKKVNMTEIHEPVDEHIVIRSVSFDYLKHSGTTFTGGSVYIFKINFPDGLSEELWAEGFPGDSVKFYFTNHNNPKAGILFLPQIATIYLLVSD